MNEFITACPRNCYSTCSFRVQVENNKITRILPYRENLATPEGPCIKGLSYIERSASEKRIVHPLLKTGAGTWKQISIQEALETASEKLLDIRERFGSKSILWYRGSGRSGLINDSTVSFWKYFGGVTTTYGNLCWPAGLEAVRMTLGSVMHNVPWDIANAKTVVIWGKNPAETNIQEMAFIEKARSRGFARIILEGNTKMEASIALYRKLGFLEIPLELDARNVTVHKRCNIMMELILNPTVHPEYYI